MCRQKDKWTPSERFNDLSFFKDGTEARQPLHLYLYRYRLELKNSGEGDRDADDAWESGFPMTGWG
jgi:hypothetical protein